MFIDNFDDKDPVLGFRVSTDDTMWAFTKKSVYRYRVKNEGRSVWRIYLELGEFEEAKKHCDGNQNYLDEVLLHQANDYLTKAEKSKSSADFREAARIFAKSNAAVTEVTLKLLPQNPDQIELNQFRNEAIIFFLENRLPRMGRYTEKALLIGWLLELYLTRLSDLIDQNGKNSKITKSHHENFIRFIEDSGN